MGIKFFPVAPLDTDISGDLGAVSDLTQPGGLTDFEGDVSSVLQANNLLTSGAVGTIVTQLVPEGSPAEDIINAGRLVNDALESAATLGFTLPPELAADIASWGGGLYGEAGTWAGAGPAQEFGMGQFMVAPVFGAIMGYLNNGMTGAFEGGFTGTLASIGMSVGGPIGGAIGALAGSILFKPDAPPRELGAAQFFTNSILKPMMEDPNKGYAAIDKYLTDANYGGEYRDYIGQWIYELGFINEFYPTLHTEASVRDIWNDMSGLSTYAGKNDALTNIGRYEDIEAAEPGQHYVNEGAAQYAWDAETKTWHRIGDNTTSLSQYLPIMYPLTQDGVTWQSEDYRLRYNTDNSLAGMTYGLAEAFHSTVPGDLYYGVDDGAGGTILSDWAGGGYNQQNLPPEIQQLLSDNPDLAAQMYWHQQYPGYNTNIASIRESLIPEVSGGDSAIDQFFSNLTSGFRYVDEVGSAWQGPWVNQDTQLEDMNISSPNIYEKHILSNINQQTIDDMYAGMKDGSIGFTMDDLYTKFKDKPEILDYMMNIHNLEHDNALRVAGTYIASGLDLNDYPKLVNYINSFDRWEHPTTFSTSHVQTENRNTQEVPTATKTDTASFTQEDIDTLASNPMLIDLYYGYDPALKAQVTDYMSAYI